MVYIKWIIPDIVSTVVIHVNGTVECCLLLAHRIEQFVTNRV